MDGGDQGTIGGNMELAALELLTTIGVSFSLLATAFVVTAVCLERAGSLGRVEPARISR